MTTITFSPDDYLALDFDGVITDSIAECLIIGHNAFVEYSGKGVKSKTLSDLDINKTTESMRLRQFIRSGEDYVYIQVILSEKTEINNQNEFDQFLQKYAHLKKQFLELFYRERELLSLEQPDLWIRLNPLYKGMNAYLKGFTRKNRLYIISTKKTEYIIRILKGHQIEFPAGHIFYAGQDRSKLNIISQLLDIYKINPSQFHFIDDQVDTLIKVESSQVQRYLAGWGYNNKEQKSRAVKANLCVLTLEKFYFSFSTAL